MTMHGVTMSVEYSGGAQSLYHGERFLPAPSPALHSSPGSSQTSRGRTLGVTLETKP